MEEKLKTIEKEAVEQLRSANDLRELDSIRVKYLGKKGSLTLLLRGMKDVLPADRPAIGKLVNQVKASITSELESVTEDLKAKERGARQAAGAIDITLPGRRPMLGRKHPLTQTFEDIIRIFRGMGFQVADGPEIETNYYNFDALNMAEHHPARDDRDSMYITDDILLRTETSAVQIRVMEKQRPPVRVIVPGRVYRRDADISHTPMFHQVEGLMVDSQDTKYRFSPDFFPFTEPSAQVCIGCKVCDGSGCQTCSGSGWLEILGSGSVDPEVFKSVDYDPEEVTGFAFGMGVERIAMLRYGINDMRALFENDMRFLQQF